MPWLLLPLQMTAADWRVVSSSEGQEVLLDVDSIQAANGEIRMWLKFDPARHAGRGAAHEMSFLSVRCAAREWRITQAVAYDRQGKAIERARLVDAEWTPVIPDSFVSGLYRAFCPKRADGWTTDRSNGTRDGTGAAPLRDTEGDLEQLPLAPPSPVIDPRVPLPPTRATRPAIQERAPSWQAVLQEPDFEPWLRLQNAELQHLCRTSAVPRQLIGCANLYLRTHGRDALD